MMRGLDPGQVAAMAAALRLSLAGEELTEVTHRLNALLEALAPLDVLPLDGVEPVPILPDEFLDPLASPAAAARQAPA